jgi:hypothetical protein
MEAQTPALIGELFASEATAHGPALLTGSGMSVLSGAQASAGTSPATLRLQRGGEIKVCPRSSLTVNAMPGGPGLMMAMNASALEINYPINNLADTLITPDFKLMLAGPGVFHFAVGVNNHGDTCIKSLRGNSSSLIVQEMLGAGVYQVKPDEAVLFAAGKISGRTVLESDCGCPEPAPMLQAKETPADAGKSSVTAPVPQLEAGAVHVQVDAPLVFNAEPVAEPPAMVAKVRFSTLPDVFLLQEKLEPAVLAPSASAQNKEVVSAKEPEKRREKKGFLGKLKGLVVSLFK